MIIMMRSDVLTKQLKLVSWKNSNSKSHGSRSKLTLIEKSSLSTVVVQYSYNIVIITACSTGDTKFKKYSKPIDSTLHLHLRDTLCRALD